MAEASGCGHGGAPTPRTGAGRAAARVFNAGGGDEGGRMDLGQVAAGQSLAETRDAPKQRPGGWISWLVVLLGVGVGLALGEGLLRVRHHDLPSVEPLSDQSVELRDFYWNTYPLNHPTDATSCARSDYYTPAKFAAATQRVGAAGKAPFTLWTAGDSITAGEGALPAEELGWASLLARRIADTRDHTVTHVNLGVRGFNFCNEAALLLAALQREEAPDLVIWQLFADDLEERAALAVGTRLVLLPRAVKSRIGRWLVSTSYLANFIWYALRPEVHQWPVRIIEQPGQDLFKATVREVQAGVEARGGHLLVYLLAPTGLPDCPHPPIPNSRCMWLASDMELMGSLMAEAGVPYLDLSHFWDTRRGMTTAVEADPRTRHDMGIHPNNDGHALLADVVYRTLFPPTPPEP